MHPGLTEGKLCSRPPSPGLAWLHGAWMRGGTRRQVQWTTWRVSQGSEARKVSKGPSGCCPGLPRRQGPRAEGTWLTQGGSPPSAPPGLRKPSAPVPKGRQEKKPKGQGVETALKQQLRAMSRENVGQTSPASTQGHPWERERASFTIVSL